MLDAAHRAAFALLEHRHRLVGRRQPGLEPVRFDLPRASVPAFPPPVVLLVLGKDGKNTVCRRLPLLRLVYVPAFPMEINPARAEAVRRSRSAARPRPLRRRRAVFRGEDFRPSPAASRRRSLRSPIPPLPRRSPCRRPPPKPPVCWPLRASRPSGKARQISSGPWLSTLNRSDLLIDSRWAADHRRAAASPRLEPAARE